MIRDELVAALATAVKQTYDQTIDAIEVGAAQPGFGDLSTNVAFSVATAAKKAPREVADVLAKVVRHEGLAAAEAAGAGFINFTLTPEALAGAAEASAHPAPGRYRGKVVVTEYSDPNPFKVLHVGHFYTTVIGDAISNLIRRAGGEVHAVNFGGDVGLHVGKTMWAILRKLGEAGTDGLAEIKLSERSEWMAARYVEGTAAYDESESAKVEINALNAQIYAFHANNDHDSVTAKVYWTCRSWSYDYFEAFYASIGSGFERYYPESETAPIGLTTVRKQLARGVYTESDGAVVFDGEKYGLHTRVFITSKGLPTYEAKDIGVLMAKWADYHFDESVVITGNDITEYMKVVLASVEQFDPKLAERTRHITHGNVKLTGGAKMSSRLGNFLRASDVLELATKANRQANGHDQPEVVLGAIKYSFLKSKIGSDLVFVPEESVSLHGNSGPYLQYAHARARNIIAKASNEPAAKLAQVTPEEHDLALGIAGYEAVLERAINELLPHHICTYLYELAQTFNRFYESSRVIGDPREAERLRLTELYADVLGAGLELLGIKAPAKI